MKCALLFVAVAFGIAAEARVMTIADQVNAMKSTWTARHNPTVRRTYKLGVASDNRQVFRKEAHIHRMPPMAADPPATFDARQQWPGCAGVISDIRDQGQCGSCWAVAAAEVFTDRLCIASQSAITVPYSSWDVATCSGGSGDGKGCDGGYPSRAWDWLMNTGVVTGGPVTNCTGCKPYPTSFADESCQQSCQSGYNTPYLQDRRKASSSFGVAQDITQIQQHIMSEGPLEAAFDVYADFFDYTSGVYQHRTGGLEGGHAVRVIGWGTESGTPYWLVANSWGTDWGMNGYFKILRGSDECGFEEAMTAGTVPGGAGPTGNPPTGATSGAPPMTTTNGAQCPPNQCQSGETCCSSGGGNWGCCPMPNSTCCTDLKHCCPSGRTCCQNFTECCASENGASDAFLSAVRVPSSMLH
jgi:cathepsin B